MRKLRKVVILAASLFQVVACSQSDKTGDSMETKFVYSLCPKTDASRHSLYEQVKAFANQQEARFVDRSAGAQQELSNMRSEVLKKTGGDAILLTVEKADELRIGISNLGLREKIAVAITSWGAVSEANPVSGFMKDLSRFWTIQAVEGGVTDEPSCSPLDSPH